MAAMGALRGAAGMKRSAARTQITSFIFGSCGGLFFICFALISSEIQPAAPSFLSEFGLPIGLVFISVGVPGAFWCWLGMRWVDKNGSWA